MINPIFEPIHLHEKTYVTLWSRYKYMKERQQHEAHGNT